MKFFHLLLLAVSTLSSVSLAEGLPELGDHAQTILTPQDEQRIGEEAMHEIHLSGLLIDDVEVTDYINSLGYKLVANSPDSRQSFSFFVIQDPSINAFALPGGFIGIHTGLIKNVRNESELASVLAHEIGHVVQHHTAQIIAKQKRATIPSMAVIVLSILAARTNPDMAMAGISASQAGIIQHRLDYTRIYEREADRIGLQILSDSGFDVNAAPAFLETLMKGARFYDSNFPSFLRTHPLTTERIADIQNRIAHLPYQQKPDSVEFDFIRAKLKAMQGNPGTVTDFFENTLKQKKYSNETAQRYGFALSLIRDQKYDAAHDVINVLRSDHQRHPMIETLTAQLFKAQNRLYTTADIYKNGLLLFPGQRGLIYGYAETLLALNQVDQAIQFLSEQQLAFPDDSYLYQLQSQAYTRLGKNLLRHQAQGEAYYRSHDLAGAIEQFEFAARSNDGDFYQKSIVEARLKQLKQQLDDTNK